MSKPTTNLDGKNVQHAVKVLQTKGFSKQGAEEIAQGTQPAGAADRSRAQKAVVMNANENGGAQSAAEKKLADQRKTLAGNWR